MEDHARFHNIDMLVWEVEKKVSNYWEMNGGGGAVMPLHQLKIWWKRKEETLKELKSALASQMVLPAYKEKKLNKKGRLCVEMMVTDHHLGKVGFDPETMEFNWTLKEAGKAYSDAIDYFLSQLDHSEISQFVLPTGNDLLNIDNTLNTTTKGTPQMAPVFWETIFRYSKELTVAVIGKLANIAPVYVYMVKGNHDKGSVFSLGEAIGCYFSESPNVKVVNETVKRPYHEFGKCMIGYTHGQELGFKNAGRAPAIDEPAMYGRTKFRAMHLGHLHTRKLKKVMETDMVDEQGGVDVEICPALCPVDRWHHENLYIGSMRRSKCFVWDRDKGMVKEIYFNL